MAKCRLDHPSKQSSMSAGFVMIAADSKTSGPLVLCRSAGAVAIPVRWLWKSSGKLPLGAVHGAKRTVQDRWPWACNQFAKCSVLLFGLPEAGIHKGCHFQLATHPGFGSQPSSPQLATQPLGRKTHLRWYPVTHRKHDLRGLLRLTAADSD